MCFLFLFLVSCYLQITLSKALYLSWKASTDREEKTYKWVLKHFLGQSPVSEIRVCSAGIQTCFQMVKKQHWVWVGRRRLWGGLHHTECCYLCKVLPLCWLALWYIHLGFARPSSGVIRKSLSLFSYLLYTETPSPGDGLWSQKFLSLNSASPFSSLNFIFIICKDEINN